MSTFVPPDTAFRTVRQRRPKVTNEAHLKFIRSLCCVICGAPNPDPAHVRAPSPRHGKRDTGGGETASDRWVNPLCRAHHDEQHGRNELAFWASYGIDPFSLALSLYACSGDEELGRQIILENAPEKTP